MDASTLLITYDTYSTQGSVFPLGASGVPCVLSRYYYVSNDQQTLWFAVDLMSLRSHEPHDLENSPPVMVWDQK